MDEGIVTFGDIETEKQKFYCYKCLIFLEDVNTDNILVSNKRYSSEINNKYFIAYLHDDYKTTINICSY